MRHSSRRKSAYRRYKRLVAALAGAAVVSSAMLPGLPLSKVQAAETPPVSAPSPESTANPLPAAEQASSELGANAAADIMKNHDNTDESSRLQHASSPVNAVKAVAGSYGFDATHDRFSLQWSSTSEAVVLVHTGKGKTFKVRLNLTDGAWKVTSVTEVITGTHGNDSVDFGDPVGVVKTSATTFGFDAYTDNFTLLSISSDKAIVQVNTRGQTFKVDLERNENNWVIAAIRGIGNSKYPATYRPASFYGYQAATAPVGNAARQTLYSTDAFTGWSWNQSTYPADMKVGVLLAQPESTAITELPSIIIGKAASIDFKRQFALYAHIGYVGSTGYGIGIEKVVQTNNDLVVTLRIKSPVEKAPPLSTITNDVITIDRANLNFNKPIHIKFIDRNGITVSNYTLYKK
ncbi:MAG: hypothetical protein H6Q72_3666 [Firmicutes bacterium]|nr:hypothetical protein [Bacillota bacterium]